MKDKLILIISIVLVVLGVIYLGYTSVRFFNRPSTTTTNNSNQPKTLNMVGTSNKDLLGENLKTGSSLKISIELENKNSERVSENLEGRVYKVKELNFFPSIDTDIPVDSKQVSATVNANSKQAIDYTYNASECGNFYMALADKDFWSKGRGKSVYGFFSVVCGANPTPTPQATLSTTVSPSKSPLGNGKATELPKSGPLDALMVLGVASILAGLGARLKVK